MDSDLQVKERPILVSAPMVRAILDGRKTMTRRIVNPQPQQRQTGSSIAFAMDDDDWAWGYKGQPNRCTVSNKRGGPTGYASECPYGQPGDRLWVRETHMIHDGEIAYAATDQPLVGCDKWKPSIYMPRQASRITLEVVSVRVERLQDITEEDAIAEGAQCAGFPASLTNRGAFAALWNKINGVDSWAANPWLWVVEFTRVLEVPHG
jgi:hypothetical protein